MHRKINWNDCAPELENNRKQTHMHTYAYVIMSENKTNNEYLILKVKEDTILSLKKCSQMHYIRNIKIHPETSTIKMLEQHTHNSEKQ